MSFRRQQRQSDFRSKQPISALHVGKYFPPFSGGIENFLADLLWNLSGLGVAASAVVHDHQPKLRGQVQELGTGSHGDASADSEAVSYRLYRVPAFGRMLYAPISPQFPGWLNRAIRAERPDILHLHLPNTSAFWALLLPEVRRIPWVIHWHADVVSSDVDRRLKFAYPLYRQFEQRLLRRADAVIVTSQAYLDDSSALVRWRDKCRIVPLGLDPSRMPHVADGIRREVETYWEHAEFRVLSVGRLTYYKGHEYLIRALEDMPEVRVLIVGEGERRRVLEKTVSNLKLNGRVRLTGNLRTDQLYALMETCDCLCLPSIERTEAFGMVLLEAMAHGKPTVVCDIRGSGVSWVVRHGRTGLVVPPRDPAALSRAIRVLSANREQAVSMGSRGLQRYQELFRMDRISSEVHQLYGELLKNKSHDETA